jgi:uncharacterized protein (DUF427 family)
MVGVTPNLQEQQPMANFRIDSTPRRIRARLGGRTVADSVEAKLVYIDGRHPEYHLPAVDVDWSSLEIDDSDPVDSQLGTHVAVKSPSRAKVGRRYVAGAAAGLVRLDFDAVEAWFEEDEQIFFHPRDPYRRVDVLESSRHVEITVAGVTVASTDRPRLVAETALPARWYIPRADVDWSLLQSSDTTSHCQYKGTADWWHVDTGTGDRLVDVAWGYERPIVEAAKLAGLVAFFAEHEAVETIIDGVVQAKPSFEPGMLNPSLQIP